jgi:hypothetical protein
VKPVRYLEEATDKFLHEVEYFTAVSPAQPLPEPSTAALLLGGLAGLAGVASLKRRGVKPVAAPARPGYLDQNSW